MKFFIEQIAIAPSDPEAAEKLLADMGAVEWARDCVTASGHVFGSKRQSNKANLAFNYDIFDGKGEFEILTYIEGPNWLQASNRGRGVSHLGMHCTSDELLRWRDFFAERGIGIAQTVFTQDHTNPVIAGKRWYNYVIFDTKSILGVDLKFIARLERPGGNDEG